MSDQRDIVGSGLHTVTARERLGFWREIGVFTRDLLIAVLVITCLVRPDLLRSWLSALGVSKATLFGLELTPGNQEKLATTISTLSQQRDAAIAERNDFAAKAADALRQLGQSRGADPRVQESLREVQTAIRSAEAQAVAAPAAQQRIIESARESLGADARWAVVFGGDATLEEARVELGWAERNGLDRPQVYYRRGSFRSVAQATSLETAQQALGIARRRRGDAYIVNFATWCPKVEAQSGYQACAN